MTKSSAVMSVSDACTRWPGLVSHDIEPSADFVEHILVSDIRLVDMEPEVDHSTYEFLQILMEKTLWNLAEEPKRTRDDVLRKTARAIFKYEQGVTLDLIRSSDEKHADIAVQSLLGKWPVELEVVYSPSPLFPEGRQRFIPMTLSGGQKIDVPKNTDWVIDCHGDKEKLDPEIINHLNRPRVEDSQESRFSAIRPAAEKVVNFDRDYYEQLRHVYGAKAAGLFVLSEAAEAFYAAVDEDDRIWGRHDVATITIPKFTATPVDLYNMYRSKDERYENYLEHIRQQAIAISADRYDPETFRPLVIIRSSAVFSEDGVDASGAGVYKSTTVDPRDSGEFKKAVEAVFASLGTKEAQDYLSEKGIDSEQMGLVIQQYIEETMARNKSSTYGHIQSSDPLGRFSTLSSDAGELQFGRESLEEFYMKAPPAGNTQPTFHYTPDHRSAIAQFCRQGAQVANAALFAEKLFGKPVELEFAFDSSNTAYIVQVRPIPHQEGVSKVEFPTDVEAIIECRAVGVGDVVVAVNDDNEYDGNEITFDWVDNESEQGGSVGWRKTSKSVFVIGHNNGQSGHIQMMAREHGQICLFPKAQTSLPNDLMREILTDDDQDRKRLFRVISDGYRGAIYSIDSEHKNLTHRLSDDTT